MKIEWLNEGVTEARIIKGWWRKRQALVERLTNYNGDGYWRFTRSGRRVGFWCKESLEVARNKEERRRQTGREWEPVAKLPVARLLT